MKIYTRTGDKGETGLFGGGRVSKDHPRVVAYGCTDELNSVLGIARSINDDPDLETTLERLQTELFHLGAELAAAAGHETSLPDSARLAKGSEKWMEDGIDEAFEAMPPMRFFVLPGGTPVAAHLHLARTVCRRAERAVLTLSAAEPVAPHLILYLNRMSDFLFALARLANHQAGVEEEQWRVR